MNDESPKPTANPQQRQRQRRLSTSAVVAQEWIDVIFDASARAMRGALLVGILVFAIVELASPEIISPTHHISSELAQTLLGAALGALGMDIYGRSRRGRRT